MSNRQRAFQFLRYGLLMLSVCLLLYLIAQAGVSQIVQHLSDIHIGWLLLTFLFMAANLCSAALRYQCLLATKVTFGRVFEVIMASFLLNYASMVQGLGLGAKIGMLKARQIPVSQSSAGIWLEICLDILFCSAVVLVFLLSVVELDAAGPRIFIVPVLLVLSVSVGIALLLRLPVGSDLVRNFVTALREVASFSRLSRALLFTVCIWLTATGGIYCMFNALKPDAGTELGLSLLAMTSGFLTGLISMVPGGIGVRELTWSYIMSQSAYPLELAGLAAILYRILTILLVSLVLAANSMRKPRTA
jgi:uncharacterized membrane protein YbhN (UPF0104 family)